MTQQQAQAYPSAVLVASSTVRQKIIKNSHVFAYYNCHLCQRISLKLQCVKHRCIAGLQGRLSAFNHLTTAAFLSQQPLPKEGCTQETAALALTG